MIEKEGFLPIGFLKAGGVQTGDHNGMRYRMIRDKDADVIRAWVWPEPFAFDAVEEEAKQTAEFPASEDGRLAAIAWMQSMYDSQREKWDSAPSLLAAFKAKS